MALMDEDYLSFKKAAELVPNVRRGGSVNPCTVWRWARHGVFGIRLETLSIGGVTCTTRQALSRFLKRVNEMKHGIPVDSGDELFAGGQREAASA